MEYPTIEEMERELDQAGWMRISATIYADPDGHWFRGPFGAWMVLRERQSRKDSAGIDGEISASA